MSWIPKTFKGKTQVWVLADEAGEPMVENGRVSMRYSDSDGAKIYNAAPANLGEGEPSKKKKKAAKKPKAPTEAHDELVWQSPLGSVYTNDVLPDELAGLDPPSPGRWEFFTDGACSKNPGPCSWGYVLRRDDTYSEASQYIGVGTNNIAEMMAIKAALEAVEDKSQTVVIHSDSSLCIGLLTKGWKAKKNSVLVAETRKRVEEFDTPPQFIKVKGHSGDPLNDRADLMATSGIERR